ncbi:MAG: DNA polymerase Y family protein [Candidatus Eremiobacteraeota bacterium]|nr:DNA polymerase Y family protein [Candidatus Eremiobacteraeota bacterium]
MTLLCVHVPSYRLHVALRELAGVRNPSVILADQLHRGHAIEATPEAKSQGVRVGMTLVQAQAAAPDATLLVHDATRSAQLWEDILDALDCVSPLIDSSVEGTAYLEMRGIPGFPQQWIEEAKSALAGIELPFRTGIAENKFSARAAAIVGDGKICAAGEERQLVARLNIATLEVLPEIIARLELLGITKLGELAALPHGPFVRRFGMRAALWHDNAQGIDRTPFLPRAHQLQIAASLYGEGSVEYEEQVYFALRMLVERVHEDLDRLGKRAALLNLQLECENGDQREVPVRIAQPTAERAMLFDLLRANVEGLRFDAPITGLRLQATELESGGVPATLFSGGDPDPRAVELALARLESTLGESATRAELIPANCLESQFTYERFGQTKSRAAVHAIRSEPEAEVIAPPQLRLLKVREIDVVTTDDAPSFVGSPPQTVLRFAGPWRIDEAWFERRIARDEYDVLLEDGALYRIFRQGAHWYVRGAYD